jgi:hypothetical protein
VRQLLNVAYSIRAEGLAADELEQLDMELGMTEDPAAEAKAALRAHQEALGLEFDDPDAPVEGTAGPDDLPRWMTEDEELG